MLGTDIVIFTGLDRQVDLAGLLQASWYVSKFSKYSNATNSTLGRNGIYSSNIKWLLNIANFRVTV